MVAARFLAGVVGKALDRQMDRAPEKAGANNWKSLDQKESMRHPAFGEALSTLSPAMEQHIWNTVASFHSRGRVEQNRADVLRRRRQHFLAFPDREARHIYTKFCSWRVDQAVKSVNFPTWV